MRQNIRQPGRSAIEPMGQSQGIKTSSINRNPIGEVDHLLPTQTQPRSCDVKPSKKRGKQKRTLIRSKSTTNSIEDHPGLLPDSAAGCQCLINVSWYNLHRTSRCLIVTSMVTIKSKSVVYYTNGYIYRYTYINGFTLILHRNYSISNILLVISTVSSPVAQLPNPLDGIKLFCG